MPAFVNPEDPAPNPASPPPPNPQNQVFFANNSPVALLEARPACWTSASAVFLPPAAGDERAAFTPHGVPQGAVGPSPAASRLDVNGGKVSSSGMPGMSCTR